MTQFNPYCQRNLTFSNDNKTDKILWEGSFTGSNVKVWEYNKVRWDEGLLPVVLYINGAKHI